MEIQVAERNLLKRVEIAWVKLKRALHITQAFFVFALPTLNVAGQFGDSRVIRQRPTRHFEFGEGPIVIEIPAIQMFRSSNVRFSRVGSQLECRLDRSFTRGQTSWRVVGANQEVELIVGERELALRLKKGWVSRQRLIEQIHRLLETLGSERAEGGREHERLGAAVEIERGHIGRRRLLNCAFLVRREPGL